MKRIILLVACVTISQATLIAQVNDTVMKQMMPYRMYDCDEVAYNAMLLAPQLYREHKTDSLNALITFWKKHCTENEPIFSLSVLNAIRSKTFKENMSENDFLLSRDKKSFEGQDVYKNGILEYLNDYRSACNGGFSDAPYYKWRRDNQPYPKDVVEYAEFHKKYYTFLKEMAHDMLGKREYAPVEAFLLRVYAAPDSVQFSVLDSPAYAETVLQAKYRLYRKDLTDIHGFSSNIHMGMWVPTGDLAVLGSHPYFTYALGTRSESIMFDALIGFRAGSSPGTYKVERYDSVYNTNNFLSWYTGFDFECKLARSRKSELDLLWGVGYEEIQVLAVSYETPNTSTSSNTITKSLKSFYANAGLGYRFYVRDAYTKNDRHKRNYFSIQAKYNYVNYNNEGGTSLKGNSITIGLIYGAYAATTSRYSRLD